MRKIKLLVFYIAFSILPFISFAQNNSVGIGTTTPDNSAILELKSTHQGFLVPRIDSVSITQITAPATGLLLYNTTDNCFWFKQPASWKRICNTDAIYQNLIDSIHLINQDITNLYDSIHNHSTQINNLYDSVYQINQTLIIYNDSLINYYQDLTNIYDTLHLHSTQINNLGDSVTVINNHINVINDSIQNYYNYFQNIYDSITTLHQDLTSILDSIAHHSQEITTINNNINTINQQINTINNHLTSIDSTLLNKWDLNGNLGTNSSVNFIGTKDNTDLVIKTTNIEALRITKDRKVGIGTSVVDPSAMLHMDSKSLGLLVPRMSAAEITLISTPANGLLVYNTDVSCFFFFKSNSWKNLCDVSFDSLFVNTLNVDSIIGHFASFDTLLANYINADTIIAHYIHSDTITANYGNITNLYNNLLYSDSIFAHYIQSDTIISHYANFNNLSIGGTAINNYIGNVVDSMAWLLKGNAGIDTLINFIGTKDSTDIPFRTNNNEKLRIKANGSVGIGTGAPDHSALVELKSASKGFLIPRLDSVQVGAISTPATGLLVYNSSDNCFWYKQPGAWKRICNTDDLYQSLIDSLTTANQDITNIYDSISHHTSQINTINNAINTINNNINNINNHLTSIDSTLLNKWDLNGNLGTNSSVNFIGTKDSTDIVIRTNNNEKIHIKADGALGVGTGAPAASALVDINSTKKGLLIPRMTTAQISTVIAPTDGLLTYNTDVNCFYYYKLNAWKNLCDTHFDSLFVSSLNVDSIIGHFANFDTLIANYIQADSIFTHYLHSDTAQINTGYITNIYNNLLHSDTILAHYVQSDTIISHYANINNLSVSNLNIGGTSILNYTDSIVDSRAWLKVGNALTNPASDFVGTTDAKDLVIRTNNIEKLRVQSGGNVGIGTNAPTAKLDVNGSFRLRTGAQGNYLLMSNDNLGNASWVDLASIHPASWDLFGNAGTNAGFHFVGTTDAVDLVFKTGNTEWMRLNTLGNVGIKTTSPTQALDVNGKIRLRTGGAVNYILTSDATGVGTWTAANSLSITNKWDIIGNAGTSAVTNFIGNTDAVDLVVRTTNLERLRVLAGGFVGIATPAPTQALDVNGKIRLRTGATNNYILTSDATGVGTWTDPNSLAITDKWDILGNTGLSAATNFIGNTDAVDLVFKTTNAERLRILAGGNVGIGTNLPTSTLDVNGQIRLRTGATNNYILTSDATGVGTWTDPNTLSWGLTGNTGTIAGTNFIGTKDAVDLVIRTNNIENIRIKSGGSVWFNGNSVTGTTPTSGVGTRMMWIPAKNAFRAGYVNSTQWDDVNIGNSSTAFDGGKASGVSSFAVGNFSIASGVNSFAFGGGNASGSNSFAANAGTASGGNSIAFGNAATSSGSNSFAVNGGIASSTGSIAFNNGVASGLYSIAFGITAVADGDLSLAIGTDITTNGHSGTFMFSDKAPVALTLSADADNQMNMRFSGGYKFYTNLAHTVGVSLASGGSGWIVISDKRLKENFHDLNLENILKSIAEMDITKWSYISQNPSINETFKTQPYHIGPMAQDFYSAFGLGEDKLGINTVDIDGVNMAAIKGLIQRTNEQTKENIQMKNEIQELKKEIEEMRKLIQK